MSTQIPACINETNCLFITKSGIIVNDDEDENPKFHCPHCAAVFRTQPTLRRHIRFEFSSLRIHWIKSTKSVSLKPLLPATYAGSIDFTNCIVDITIVTNFLFVSKICLL